MTFASNFLHARGTPDSCVVPHARIRHLELTARELPAALSELLLQEVGDVAERLRAPDL